MSMLPCGKPEVMGLLLLVADISFFVETKDEIARKAGMESPMNNGNRDKMFEQMMSTQRLGNLGLSDRKKTEYCEKKR